MRVDLQRLLEPTDATGLKSVLMGRDRMRTEPTGVTVDLGPMLSVVNGLDRNGRRRDWDRAVVVPLRDAVARVPRRLLVDIRCWRFLAVGPLRGFVLDRWMPDWTPESGALTVAQTRRFLGSQSNQGFARNAVARLWRMVDALDDPGLVDRALDDQELFNTVFERDLGNHRPTARACTAVLCGLGVEESRFATQELNILGSTVCLEALDQATIEAHLRRFLERC